ncbi:MAG TPA: hypothetical protein PKH07_18855, partial [bacterium]|nr:hypothetical protein [bacterium]
MRSTLRAIVLASKMGFKATDEDDAIEALSELTGTDAKVSTSAILHLKDELNILEWDERFKEFVILADAVPRPLFLAWLRQKSATYSESGKAELFAGMSRKPEWSDLLGDIDCDFAEQKKITTKEWRYQGVCTNRENVDVQIKLAADRWEKAIGVDEPRGTIIYCYLARGANPDADSQSIIDRLRDVAKAAATPALPILVVLLYDKEGALGQALAEIAVLDESVGAEERARFGNLIPAHREKMCQI